MSTMSPYMLHLIYMMMVAFLLGGIGSFFFAQQNKLATWFGSTCAIIGAAIGTLIGLIGLTQGTALYKAITAVPFLPFSIRIDALSGLFLMIIGTISILATVYGIGYMRHYADRYSLGNFYGFFNFFLGSMMLVVLANNALYFLFFWEIMSLASYFLVIFDHKEKENVSAGLLYFVITHIATSCLLVMSFLLYKHTGSLEFETWRATIAYLSPNIQNVVLVLALIGFGTKAGIIPLHVWLPAAHPAAPSQVSALMSGVMIKLGVFMLIRMYLDFFAQTPLWLGLLVLALGALSSILGVLYALGEHDIKRLLAYHSIENIGIILLGVGGALAFRSLGNYPLALIALAGGLFHTVNHAIFKSLLFLSAGSVVAATHTRNIEHYGGLIKRMPATALFFLVGSIAISGIIPFNGFVSEWLTYQSLIVGIGAPDLLSKSIVILGIASLAFTSGLAAACFVKAFGITFLARPRSDAAKHAVESDGGMKISMGVLALSALLFGLAAAPLAHIFLNVAASIPSLNGGLFASYFATDGLLYISLFSGGGLLSMPFIAGLMLVSLVLVWVMVKLLTRKAKVVRAITWDCGFPLNPRMEITGTAFAHAIVTVFRKILRPTEHSITEHSNSISTGDRLEYGIQSRRTDIHLTDIYHHYVYNPLMQFALRTSTRVSKIQSGSINTYLLYILITFALLLAWAITTETV